MDEKHGPFQLVALHDKRARTLGQNAEIADDVYGREIAHSAKTS